MSVRDQLRAGRCQFHGKRLSKRRKETTWTAIVIYSKVRRTGVHHGTQRAAFVMQGTCEGLVRKIDERGKIIRKVPDDKTD
jgi:hypothetical protein